MQFKKYQHVERLGTPATEGILNGTVYIFSKLDGSNTSIYLNDKGQVEVASRNRVLHEGHDNAGALAYVVSRKKFKGYLRKHPNHRLFGEWLVPHHIRYYRDDAWRKIYIFDVMTEDVYGNESYLTYEEYKPLLEEFGLEYIPLLDKFVKPKSGIVPMKALENLATYASFLTDGARGEGIVIKNYDFVNQFGNTVWAKVVNPIAQAAIKMHKPLNGSEIEAAIVKKFVTPELVEKEFAKLVVEGVFASKFIGKLLGMVWYTFISEEMFNVLRKFKNPKIDFGLLHKLTVDRVKEIKSEVFQ